MVARLGAKSFKLVGSSTESKGRPSGITPQQLVDAPLRLDRLQTLATDQVHVLPANRECLAQGFAEDASAPGKSALPSEKAFWFRM